MVEEEFEIREDRIEEKNEDAEDDMTEDASQYISAHHKRLIKDCLAELEQTSYASSELGADLKSENSTDLTPACELQLDENPDLETPIDQADLEFFHRNQF